MLKYRPEIDGLRAVAVLSVVIFHFFSEILPGGFVGVDIFFVISGYLITSIIYRDAENSSFSYVGFYKKRALRIFPALAMVLAVCLAYGWFYLIQGDYRSLGKHVFSGAFFFSNISLLLESGYFDTESALKPLLHLWSLGVEEQFYLIWPIVISLVATRKRWGGCLYISILLFSFSYCVYSTIHNAAISYYSPFTRFWELMVGALLSMLTFKSKSFTSAMAKYQDVFSILGVLLIFYSVFFISKDRQFPGYLAMAPVAGAFFVIATGGRSWVGRVLSFRPLVSIGIVSYPLYLWHWPILSFFRIKTAQAPNLKTGLVLIAIALFLSVLTYVFIERRVRFGANKTLKSVVVSLFLAVVGMLGVITFVLNGIPERKVNLIANEYTSITNVYDYFGYGKIVRWGVCHSVTPKAAVSNGCISTSKNQIFIWGDSYAAALYNGLRSVIDNNEIDINISQMTDGNGPPFYNDSKRTDSLKTLTQANDERLFFVKKYQPKIVLITWMISGANAPVGKENTLKSLGETVSKIKKASPNSRVVIVGPVPEWEGGLVAQIVKYYREHQRPPPVYMSTGLRSNIRGWDLFFSKNVPNIGAEYISAYSVMCNHGKCLTRVSEGPMGITAVDWGHLTKPGAEYLIGKIKDKLFK